MKDNAFVEFDPDDKEEDVGMGWQPMALYRA